MPRLTAECAEQWGLRLEAPYAGSHVSLAVPAGDAVLKLNFPHPESELEADALAHWDGDGAVRLLARDDARRALLIERCTPGDQLWAQDDAAATETGADVLARLHRRPAAGPFHTLAEAALRWARELPRRWEAHGRPGDAQVIAETVRTLPELAATQAQLVVVHQDLHGGNVLGSSRGWLAIDPKPLIAEPAFDCASLIRDRRDALRQDPHPARTLERRLTRLCAALELDRERVRAWAVAHALAWGIQADAVYPMQLACAEWLARGT